MIWVLMFGSLFLAELPDKTSLATLALLRHHAAVWVWLGAALALIAQTILSLSAGRLLALVPQKPLAWFEIVLFFGFAVWLYKESKETDHSPVDGTNLHSLNAQAIVLQTFFMVFLAEFFDLTQIATVAYAARYPHQLIAIGVIASTALLAANGLMILIGRYLLRRVPGHWMQRGAALIFGVIAAIMGLTQLGVF